MQEDISILAGFYRLVDWFEANRKQAAIGAGIVVLVALIVSYYFWNRGQKEVNAGDALTAVLVRSSLVPGAAASAADGYRKVAEDFAGTRAAGQALLQAGTDFFTQGRYDDALSSFQQMTREYPDSAMMPQAQYGIAACLDAQGKSTDALAAYQHVAQSFRESDVAPAATYSAARILESQGKLQDAVTMYEEIVKTYGLNNSIGSEAGMRSEEVQRRLSMSGPAPQPEAAVTPSFSPSDFTRSLTNLTITPNKP